MSVPAATSGDDTLILVLQKTFSPDQNEIHAAEQYLYKLYPMPGCAAALMRVMTNNTLPLPVRQAASISFKTVSVLGWSQVTTSTTPSPSTSPALPTGGQAAAPTTSKLPVINLSEEDKAFIRNNIIEAICFGEPVIKKQLAVTLQKIAFREFPERWPDLITKIVSFITSNNQQALFGALIALRQVIRNFEFVTDREAQRKVLNDLVAATFPLLEKLMDMVAALPEPTIESLQTERLLLKMFWSVGNMTLPPYLVQNAAALAKWLSFTVNVLERPTKAAHVPSEQAHNALHNHYWKAVKRASEICLRWLLRYGKNEDVQGKDRAEVRKAVAPFQSQYMPTVVLAFLNLLARREQIEATVHVVQWGLTFLGNATRYKKAYEALKPHTLALVQQLAFPIIRPTQEDLDLFRDDPREYIRSEFEWGSEMDSNRTAATNLVVDICKFRAKSNFLPIMQFISEMLQKSTQTGNVPDKFAALVLVMALEGKLKKTEPYKSQLEQMLKIYVLPDLVSPHGILRAIAVQTFGRYCDIKWSDPSIFSQAMQHVVALASDVTNQFAVSVHAAMALKMAVQVPAGKDLLRPVLGQLFDLLFRLIDMPELDLDDLVMTLEVLVEIYGEEVAPYAFNICKHMAEAFTAVAYTDMEGDEGAVLKAVGCLETIGTIMTALHTIPDLFRTLTIALIPLVTFVLGRTEEQSLDYISDIFNLLQQMTQWAKPFPAELWPIFPLIHKTFKEVATDYLADMLPCLDNFVDMGKETFLSDPHYQELIFDIVRTLIADPSSDEIDSLKACQLAEVVFHHCKGRTDGFVTAVLGITCDRLPVVKMSVFKVLLVELIMNGFYYNPLLTIQVLESKSYTAQIIDMAFELRSHFYRPYDKKLFVLGFSSLFLLPFAQLPASIQSRIKPIVKHTLYHLKELQKQQKRMAEEEAKFRDEEHERNQNEVSSVHTASNVTVRHVIDEEDEEEDEEIGSEEGDIEVDLGDDDEDDDEDLGEDEDEWDEEDLGSDEDIAESGETIESLAAKCEEFRLKRETRGDGEDSEEELERFMELDDEEIMSPVNQVNEVLFFVDSIKTAAENPADSSFRMALMSLQKKEQNQVQSWMAAATQIRSQQQQQAPHP